MRLPEAVNEVLQHCNQPAVDHYVTLVERGQPREAVQALLKDEGHWLTRYDAEEFVSFILRQIGD